MLNYIRLYNFGKHEKLEVNFTPGVNAIRAANEGGKSTLYLALMFALYGSRALPLSMEETVTWGHKPSELRVELGLTIDNVEYEIYRTAGSAEMKGNGVIHSGQTGVTEAVTKLLRANLDTARKVLVANQNDVRRAIEEGSDKLIEDLSEINTIDQLIIKVKEQCTTGSTKDLDRRVEELAASTATAPTVDYSAEDEQIRVAQNALAEHQSKVDAAQALIESLTPKADLAQQRLRDMAGRRQALAIAERARDQAQATLAGLTERPVHDMGILEAGLQRAMAAHAVRQAYADFQRLDKPQSEGSYEDFVRTLNESTDAIQGWKDEIAGLREQLKHHEAHVNGKDTCPTCGRAYDNAEDVRRAKEEAERAIAAIHQSLTSLSAAVSSKQAHAATLREVEAKNVRTIAAAEKISYIVIDKLSWPAQYTFTATVPEDVDMTDYEGLIRETREAQNFNANIAGQRAAARQALDIAEKTLAEGLGVEWDESALEADIRNLSDANTSYMALAAKLGPLRDAVDFARSARAKKELDYSHHMSRYEADKARLQELRDQVAKLVLHNGIIKKLRDARVTIANRLWSMVLAVVSEDFSSIRGIQSTVGKGDKGFTIDGRPMAAFSGSTVDSLALSVRGALQTIFLPMADFSAYDEPAAAMDDERETALLGNIVRSSVPQKLVVTHSNLADTFANNLIEL